MQSSPALRVSEHRLRRKGRSTLLHIHAAGAPRTRVVFGAFNRKLRRVGKRSLAVRRAPSHLALTPLGYGPVLVEINQMIGQNRPH